MRSAVHHDCGSRRHFQVSDARKNRRGDILRLDHSLQRRFLREASCAARSRPGTKSVETGPGETLSTRILRPEGARQRYGYRVQRGLCGTVGDAAAQLP